MEYEFEGVIEKLLLRQRKTKKSLADAMQMTRQGFDTKLKNKTVFVKELATIATFFEMDEVDLVAELSNKSDKLQPKKTEGGTNGLEERMAKLEGQLAVKDQQIAGLQRMLESVLGKSEGAIDMPSSLYGLTMDEKFEAYKRLGSGLSLQLLSKVQFKQITNPVAPRFHKLETR